MNKPIHALLASVLALAPRAFAQSAAAPVPAAKEAILELSPFVVDASSDVGYAAQNTLAGSRLNTSLRDVASPLEVFTREFLNDIGATSVTDAMLYHSNAQEDLGDENPDMQQDYKAQAQVPNRFMVRGQQQTLARDYFNFNLPQDLFSTDRVDASRGPNSILFGIGNAGGVTNTQSKTANFYRNATSVTLQAGSYSHRRATIDHNQVVNKSFALRLNLLTQQSEGWQAYDRDDKTGAQLATLWRIGKKTRFRTDAEYGTRGDYASRTYPVITKASQWTEAGRPVFDPSVVRTNAQIDAQSSSRLTMPNVNTGQPVALRLINATSADNTERFVYIDNGAGLFFSSANRYDLVATGVRQLGQDEIYGTMINGPGALRDLRYKTFSAFLEHQFSRNFQVELAANHWAHNWSAIAFGNEAQLSGEASTLFNRQAPASVIAPGARVVDRINHGFAGRFFYEDIPRPDERYSDNTEVRLTASYKLDTKRFGQHRFAGLLSSFDGSRGVIIKEARVLTDGFGNLLREPEAAGYALVTRHYVADESAPGEYRNADTRSIPATVTDPFTGRVFQTGYGTLPGPTTYSESGVDSALLSMQNFWFDGRLVTKAGYRHDKSTTVSYGTQQVDAAGLPTGLIFRDPATFQAITNRKHITRDVKNVAKTSTLGAVFHVNDRLSLTYNRSSNAGPPFGGWAAPNLTEPINLATQKGTGDNEPLAPTGKSEDYGIKLSLLKERLFITANYFKTNGTGALTFNDSGFDNRFAEIISALAGQQVFRNAAEQAAIPNGRIGLLTVDSQRRIVETAPNSGMPAYEVVPNLIPQGMPQPAFTAKDDDYQSTGYELNVVANLTRHLSLRAGYSYTERKTFDTWRMAKLFTAKVREWATSGRDFDPALLARLPVRRIGALTEDQAGGSFAQDSSNRYYLTALDVLDYDLDEGLRSALDAAKQGFGQRNHKANLWVSYKFTDGGLKGLSAFGGVRYQSGAEVGYRLFIDANGTPRRDESKVETNGSQLFNDAGLSYRTKADWLKEGASLRLQLNVRNIFDDTDYDPARHATDAFGRIIVTRYYVPQPRSFTFSATASF